jgi:hypothetical protein
MKNQTAKPSLTDRDKIIKSIRKDYKAWTDPVRHLFGQSTSKKDGYKLRRAALRQSLMDAGLGDLDTQLTKAVDGDQEIDAWLCRLASILLFKLAETDPPPLKWFPKELAMHASVKLQDLADAPPTRHQGTNPADYDSRDYFSITEVLKVCKEYKLKPTRNRVSKADCGCSLVAEGMGLSERAVIDAWSKRKHFGFD